MVKASEDAKGMLRILWTQSGEPTQEGTTQQLLTIAKPLRKTAMETVCSEHIMLNKWAGDGWSDPAPPVGKAPTNHRQQIDELRKEAAEAARQYHANTPTNARDTCSRHCSTNNANQPPEQPTWASTDAQATDSDEEQQYLGPEGPANLDDSEEEDGPTHATSTPKRLKTHHDCRGAPPALETLTEQMQQRIRDNREAALARQRAKQAADAHAAARTTLANAIAADNGAGLMGLRRAMDQAS